MLDFFLSQAERRQLGGSDFLEIQFCRLPRTAKLESIVPVDSIKYWRDDSLYVSGDDAERFLQEYAGIFGCGIYNNLAMGAVDLCGINYYRAESVAVIIAKLIEKKPTGFETLLSWLDRAKQYNGFYILGL